MKLLLSTHFKKDYRNLPPHIKRKVKKQLRILAKDLTHPSLRAKKMKGQPRFWEARVDRFWRMSFQKEKDEIRLCRVGPHEILRK